MRDLEGVRWNGDGTGRMWFSGFLVNPKGINAECSLEGLMLKLKLQCFGHLMRRADSLETTLMLRNLKTKGEEGDDRG